MIGGHVALELLYETHHPDWRTVTAKKPVSISGGPLSFSPLLSSHTAAILLGQYDVSALNI